MACHLTGAKPLSEPMLELRTKLQWNLNRNSCIFIQENAFKNVVSKMSAILSRPQNKADVNSVRLRQNVRNFPADICNWIFVNEEVWILLKISLAYVLKVWINNIPAWVQIMVWRRPGDKPIFEPLMVSLLKHIFIIRPQWVNYYYVHNFHQLSISKTVTLYRPQNKKNVESAEHIHHIDAFAN